MATRITKQIRKPVRREGFTTVERAAREADGATIAAFKQGDPRAAYLLHERYSTRILGLGMTLLGNRADAEDLVQDTLLKLFRSAATYDPERASLDTWVLLAARRLAIDALRRRPPQATVEPEEAARLEDSTEPGPEHIAEQGDLLRRTREAIERLPSGQRSVLLLTSFAHHSLTQAAALQGLPLGTVKSRRRQGMITLRRLLAEEDAA